CAPARSNRGLDGTRLLGQQLSDVDLLLNGRPKFLRADLATGHEVEVKALVLRSGSRPRYDHRDRSPQRAERHFDNAALMRLQIDSGFGLRAKAENVVILGNRGAAPRTDPLLADCPFCRSLGSAPLHGIFSSRLTSCG